MALNIIVTNAGRAALVNASKNGTAPVTISHVGISASAVTPSRTATALPGEIKRVATLSGDVVAGDTIHLVVRDESSGVYTLRSFALYLADGTLFAIYGQADIILEKSSQALMLLAIDVQFADVNATQLTFGDTNFLNPPATTERQGVVELATEAEARAGVDALRALTAAGARAAILGWLLAQDGAGSGLDADLLDGRDGSYYAKIADRLGYTPANRAGDIFSGAIKRDEHFYLSLMNGSPVINFDENDCFQYDRGANGLSLLIGGQERFVARANGDFSISGTAALTFNSAPVWHAGNDGSGSGLDADLLDGQHGAFYTNIPARLGFMPANRAGDTFSGPIKRDEQFYLSMVGESPILNFDADDYLQYDRSADGLRLIIGGQERFIARRNGDFSIKATAALTFNGAVVWHAGNDGAGSGLDADLLDGLQSGDFAKMTDFAGNLSATGFQRLPGGLILQWGEVIAPSGGVNNLLFPFAFPDRALFALATNRSGAVPTAWAGAGNLTRTGMTVGHASASLTPSAAGTSAFWFALGA